MKSYTQRQIEALIKKGKSVVKMDYKELKIFIKDKKSPSKWRIHYSGFANVTAMENAFDFMLHNKKNFVNYVKPDKN